MRKNQTATPPKAVIYARVSSREQSEGYSIDAQLGYLRAYADLNGIQVVEEIVEAHTAKESGRPGFAKLCSMLNRGEASLVLAEKTDRLYRNISDAATLRACGATIHLAKESQVLNAHSLSSAKLMHNIQLVLAENFSNNLSEEARKGMLEKAKQGYWPSAAPVGYLNVIDASGRRVIVPDPNTAHHIRHLFELYATGDYSIRDLRDESARIGFVSKAGTPFALSRIQSWLANPLYAGVVRWSNQDFQGKHEPIVSPKTFDKVQSIASGRSVATQPCTKKEFTYSGLIRCTCGCLCSPYLAKGQYVYYACTGHRGCKRDGIREDVINQQIAKAFQSLVVPPSLLPLIRESLRSHFSTIQSEHDRMTTYLKARAKDLEQKLERLYMDYATGRLPERLYDKLLKTLTHDIETVETELRQYLSAKRRTWEDVAGLADLFSNLDYRFNNAPNHLKRELFKNAVSNCTKQGNTIHLDLRAWFKVFQQLLEETHQKDAAYCLAGLSARLAEHLATFAA
jgi:site-specific DNA recombinase